jgi:hypothetical protein
MATPVDLPVMPSASRNCLSPVEILPVEILPAEILPYTSFEILTLLGCAVEHVSIGLRNVEFEQSMGGLDLPSMEESR